MEEASIYDEFAEVEFDFGVALLYLDGARDFDRVLPVLRAWHDEGAPLLLRGASALDLPEPKTNRLASTIEDPDTGAFSEFRPRTWATGLRADIGRLRISWHFDTEYPPIYQAGQDLYRFRDSDHIMLRADVSRHGPHVDADALRELLLLAASLCDPVYGEIVVGRNTPAPGTERDRELRRNNDRSESSGRSRLRGFEWATVCPAELVARLGGVDALWAGGAFHAVTALPSGAALLQATERPEAYDEKAAALEGSALAAALEG